MDDEGVPEVAHPVLDFAVPRVGKEGDFVPGVGLGEGGLVRPDARLPAGEVIPPPALEKGVGLRGVPDQHDAAVEILPHPGGVEAQTAAHVHRRVVVRMLREGAVQVPAGRQRGGNPVNVVQRTDD